MLKQRFMYVWVLLGPVFATSVAHAQATQEPISIKLLVPISAQVELDGAKMKSTGVSRVYLSPPVPVGPTYKYSLKVSVDGKTVTRDITVRSGAENTFDLRSAFGTAERQAAYPSMGQSSDSAADDKQVVDSKATHKPAASSVNFRKDLNLPFASLATLGARVDAARRAPDPVTLAHAASELSIAEKVSGKQASLTSSALMNESAELAKLRRKAAELKAVSAVAEQIASEQELIKSLRAITSSAEAEAKADTQAVQQNLEPTWKPRKVIVNNYTTQYLTIYVNGIYKTEIGPGLASVIIVEHRWNPTVLTAHGDQDIDSWGPRTIWGRFTSYTWNIN